MTFEEYWKQEGCRHFAPHHEDRAQHAWMAFRQQHTEWLKKMLRTATLIRDHSAPGSTWIAFDGLVEEIEKEIKNV